MSTFQELKEAVDAWLARDDISIDTLAWPIITRMAESRISRKVRTVAQEKSVDLTVDARRVPAPADFLEARALYVDSNMSREIDYLTPEALRKNSAWNSAAGQSPYYTIEGNDSDGLDFVFAPAGNATSPFTVPLLYFAKFTVLVNPADTNWLLNNHIDIYMYACLRAAAEFIEEDALEDRYEIKFRTAVKELSLSENRKRFRGNVKKAVGPSQAIV